MSTFFHDREGEPFWPASAGHAGITIRHTSADGTLIEGSSKGDGVWEIARSHGFRFSHNRNVGIYLPQSRDKAPKQWVINRLAEALRSAGHEVEVAVDAVPRAAEEAEADRLARLSNRADRLSDKAERHAAQSAQHGAVARQILDFIPFGQPILVGHHSEGRHRRALDKVDRNIRAELEHDAIAVDAARRAEVAARNAEGRIDVGAVQRRIKKHEVELRRIDRALAPCSFSGRRFKPEAVGRTFECPKCYRDHAVAEDRTYPEHGGATGDYREQLLTQQAFAAESLRYDRERLAEAQASGAKVWGPDDFDRAAVKAGRVFASCWVNRTGAQVVRVNAKSVTVKTAYSWTETIPYDGIRGVVVRPSAE